MFIKADEVLDETKKHYQNQFRLRNFDQEILKERWMENYKPKKEIKEEWFQDLDQSITEKEWSDMLAGLKKNTAPGISGITYSLIQAGSSKTQEIFRVFAEICIRTGRIPKKWKVSRIYPIPKEGDWQYNLGNVRPIALLETFRKCTTKILTKRITQVIVEKKMLKGPNFAGLPGNSTEEPVHIMNTIIEDAKENNKEL